jgi:hypothetical protein
MALSSLLLWKYPVMMPFLDSLVKTERVLPGGSKQIFKLVLGVVELCLFGVLFHDLRASLLLTFRLSDLAKELRALVKKSASRLSGSEG